MPLFHYSANDGENRLQQGEESAASAQELRERLAARGLKVLRVDEVLEIEDFLPAGTLTTGDAALLAQRVAEVTQLGLPLESGLRAVAEESPSRRMRKMLNDLAADLEKGESLDRAVSRREGHVAVHLLQLIRAGLQTGTLAFVLERYVASIRRTAEIRQRLALALAYPAAICLAGVLVLAGVMFYIVPQFANIFEGFDTELPDLTKALVWTSDVLMRWSLWLGLFTVVFGSVAVVGGLTFSRTRTGRRLLCLIPILGPLLRLTALAQFAHLLAQFLETRTEMPKALELAGAGSGDSEIAWAAEGLAHEVRMGVPLADAAVMNRGIPVAMRQMLRWSTNPQRFPEALHSAAEMCLARASVHSTVIGPMLEPLALLGSAIVFGTVIIALFMPLIKLLNDLS